MTAHVSSGRWLAAPPPSAAVEIAPRRVTAVSIARRGGAVSILKHATEALPEGAVTPSLTATNVQDVRSVVGALKQVFSRLGGVPRRVALVVPDTAAKVSLVRFEKVPERADDLDQVVRWQVRKTAPFRIEDAQVSFTPGAPAPEGGREFVVVLARREVVAEYEAVCAAAGAHAGIVDLATLNLVNLVLAGPPSPATEGDWLLVNVTPEYTSVAIVRGRDLVFFRSRRAEGEGDLPDLVHQTAMYYEDRLSGAGFRRVVLAGAAASGGAWSLGEAERLRQSLETRLGTRVEAIDPRLAAPLRDRISAAPDLLDALASPVGLLLRDATVAPATEAPAAAGPNPGPE